MEFDEDLEKHAEKLLENLTESSGSEVPEPDIQKNSQDRQLGGSKIPAAWDPQEIKFLTRNRTRMSNEDMKQFFERDSDFHEKFSPEDWKGFSRTEERFMIQNFSTMTPEEMAGKLDRSEDEIVAKAHMMGLNISDE